MASYIYILDCFCNFGFNAVQEYSPLHIAAWCFVRTLEPSAINSLESGVRENVFAHFSGTKECFQVIDNNLIAVMYYIIIIIIIVNNASNLYCFQKCKTNS